MIRTILLAMALCGPVLPAAASKPCVGTIVRVIEGATIIRQPNGKPCVGSVKALPIAPRKVTKR